MDAKDLRVESTIGEPSNDGTTKYTHNSNSHSCDKNKSYQDMGSNSLAKVDVPTARPCAVIGPDRVVPPPVVNETYLKKPMTEPWSNTDNYHRLPDYPLKMSEYQNPSRNISPRQTFQENMQRIMVPPRYNSVKVNDDSNFPLSKNFKLNMPSEGKKYCDVPYNVNPVNNEQKNIRNADMCVSSMNPVFVRSAPQGWPHGSVNVRPTRPYGAPEVYQYTEYPSCAGPRPVQFPRSHRTIHDEPGHIYPDTFYQEGNVRFKPYASVKDRYPQVRYDYLGNYSNPFHQPPFPSHKYELQKSLPTHPYSSYPQVPLKYLDPRIMEPIIDGYQRPNPQANYNMQFHNQIIHPNYGPMPGNCLQNKAYPYSQDSSVKSSIPSNKLPYDNNNKLCSDFENTKGKNYNLPDNFYINDTRTHPLKSQGVPGYSTVNMHVVPPHPYYRKENPTMKSYECIPHQFRNIDPSYNINNSMSRIQSQFSPNSIAISPCDSITSNDTIQTHGTAQEDCGYVSQSSTTSVRSVDSCINRLPSDYYRRYDYRFGSTAVKTHFFPSKSESNSKNNVGTKNKDIDVRQFLQMWNEGDEESGENNKDVVQAGSKDNTKYEVVNNQQQLYVLDLVNVPSEDLSKYEHIQKVSKLPENIKGYNNIELLDQFEEAIESSNITHFQNNHTSRITQITSKNTIMSQTNELIPRPISPLDVEAKISQSVIHKEVGCNFEIKPCSPKMMNAEVAAPIQSILDERAIEKIANPHNLKSPGILHSLEENKNCFSTIHPQNSNLSLNERKIPSCKMINSPYSNHNTTETVKNNYSLQDLEITSGLCLASLPRLDNDIELNFPEVNQQFINANKVDSVITVTSSKDLPTLDIEQSNSETLLKDSDETNYNNLSDFSKFEIEKDITKLNKFRKPKKHESELSESNNIMTNIQPIRTDSVIIKNPETVKTTEEQVENTFSCINKLDSDDHNDPLNLKLQSSKPILNTEKEFSVNDITNFTDIRAINSTSPNISSTHILCKDDNVTAVTEDFTVQNDINIKVEKLENQSCPEVSPINEFNQNTPNLNQNDVSCCEVTDKSACNVNSEEEKKSEVMIENASPCSENIENIDINATAPIRDSVLLDPIKLSIEITEDLYLQNVPDEFSGNKNPNSERNEDYLENDDIQSDTNVEVKINGDTLCDEKSQLNCNTINVSMECIPRLVRSQEITEADDVIQNESVLKETQVMKSLYIEDTEETAGKCSTVCDTIISPDVKDQNNSLPDSLESNDENVNSNICLNNEIDKNSDYKNHIENNISISTNCTNHGIRILGTENINTCFSHRNYVSSRVNKEHYSPIIQNLLMFNEGLCKISTKQDLFIQGSLCKISEMTNSNNTVNESEKINDQPVYDGEFKNNLVDHVNQENPSENCCNLKSNGNHSYEIETCATNVENTSNKISNIEIETCATNVENTTNEISNIEIETCATNVENNSNKISNIENLKCDNDKNNGANSPISLEDNLYFDICKPSESIINNKNESYSFNNTHDNNVNSDISMENVTLEFITKDSTHEDMKLTLSNETHCDIYKFEEKSDSVCKNKEIINNDLSIINEVSEKQRVSLKRSLSDSAINMYEDISKSESQENCWPKKRKKIVEHDDILGTQIITQSLCNIIQNNRRKSISTMYNEENVSFCILIDDGCIITEDDDENEKNCPIIPNNCLDNQQNENTAKHEHSITETVDEICDYSDTFTSEYSEGKNSLEESWVDDVACVETVVSDDIAMDIVISAPTTPKHIDISDCIVNSDESQIFNNNLNDYMDKVKYIYGEKMCKDDAELVETLYKTPQMNVNKTFIVKESQVPDKIFKFYDDDCLERILSDTLDCQSNINTSKVVSQYMKTVTDDKENVYKQNTSSIIKELDCSQDNCSSKIETIETQDDTVHSCESSIDELLSNAKVEETPKYTSSSPEVSSTTSEEKPSSILLKITNYKGSRMSHIPDINSKNCQNKPTFKCTEDKDYSYSDTNLKNRPLITKAAQKYIPPLKETLHDLKVKLPLPQHSLIKLKQLKISQQEPKSFIDTLKNHNISKAIPKKPKPKFEDVLKSIDEIQFKMHKEKCKKSKKSIPKVVIKKNENGSHYASTSQNYNPDLTGRKWQPWVFLEKNFFIDKMALKSKTKAIYSHRKNTFVLAEKFYKYKSTSANFVIAEPETKTLSSGQLKCTIRLKHGY